MGEVRRRKGKEENHVTKISKNKKGRNVIFVITSFLHFTRHGTLFILSKL